MSKRPAASTTAAFAQILSAAMEWTPSEKMTFTDLRAILASWDIPSISNDKSVLITEVAKHYREIMLARGSRRPIVPSFVLGLPSFPPGVARSSGDDKSIGTDCPRTERSYIGSDEPARDDDVSSGNITELDLPLIRDFEAACAAEDDKREQAESSACAAAVPDEPAVEGAACAAADPEDDELSLPVVRPPSLRRALELEKEATAKAKADKTKDKAKKAVAKSKNKLLYGYLPMAGAFIDEDQKRDDKKDPDDVTV